MDGSNSAVGVYATAERAKYSSMFERSINFEPPKFVRYTKLLGFDEDFDGLMERVAPGG